MRYRATLLVVVVVFGKLLQVAPHRIVTSVVQRKKAAQ